MRNRFSSDIRMEVCEGCKQGQLAPVPRAGSIRIKVRLAADSKLPLAREAPDCPRIRGPAQASPPFRAGQAEVAMHEVTIEMGSVLHSRSAALRLMATAMSYSKVVFKDLVLMDKDLQLARQPQIGRDLRA